MRVKNLILVRNFHLLNVMLILKCEYVVLMAVYWPKHSDLGSHFQLWPMTAWWGLIMARQAIELIVSAYIATGLLIEYFWMLCRKINLIINYSAQWEIIAKKLLKVIQITAITQLVILTPRKNQIILHKKARVQRKLTHTKMWRV